MKKQCLNGYWDIIPLYKNDYSEEPPKDAWISNKYIVPSPWNKSLMAYRKNGEKYFRQCPKEQIKNIDKVFGSLGDDTEFLFDGFGYPTEWSKTQNAWLRRKFTLAEKKEDAKYFIKISAASPRFKLFINAKKCGEHYDPTLPFETDVTELILQRENEITVLIEGHLYDERGRTLVPSGNMFTTNLCGIWQDVWLIERNEIHITDFTIITSTRKKNITLRLKILNSSSSERRVIISNQIRESQKDENAKIALKFPDENVIIPPCSEIEFQLEKNWCDANWWTPQTPYLYFLESKIIENGSIIEKQEERFGFREIWIDGRDIMLNDHPIHLFSDWGHKCSPYHLTENWIRKWYKMIKDCNMNHSRLHTHPHPEIFLDLADEMGIMITGETAIHGSGGAQAADSLDFWKNAEDHIRRYVRRDKNHPCLILWSVENEMRWNGDQSKLTFQMLPKMRRLFNDLDPTRPAYHDGDSSLWDENEQDIISRHYGKECSGEGWWDGSKPLHSGEMCLYHYAGPNNTLHISGDAVFANYDEIDKAAAIDTALIIEAARANGVCCLGPWNISCLQNLRLCEKDVKLSYGNLETPGVKPIKVAAYSSEFEFWKDGTGYSPNHSFEIQKNAFRPFALIDKSFKKKYFTGSNFRRIIYVVNDTGADVYGKLYMSFSKQRAKKRLLINNITISLMVPNGSIIPFEFNFQITEKIENGRYFFDAKFVSNGKNIDSFRREILICRKTNSSNIKRKISIPIAVVGRGYLRAFLSNIGADFAYFVNFIEAIKSGRKIIIAERNSLQPNNDLITELKKFCVGGGRLIVLEQILSIFPEMPIEGKSVLKAFSRAFKHPILRGVKDEDLFMWGEDSYASQSSNSSIAENLYKKAQERHNLSILDTGEGGFGDGDIEYSVLFESNLGRGCVIASQLRITDKIESEPVAEKIFLNILEYAQKFKPPKKRKLIIYEKNKQDESKIFDKVLGGNNLLIENINDENELIHLCKTFNMKISLVETRDEYQAVRAGKHPLISGISNWDSCGIELFCYSNQKTCENFRIGNKFIRLNESFTPLFTTAPNSMLKEFFVYGGKTEFLRSHTVSKYLYSSEAKEVFAVIACKKIGKGYLIISQFCPEKEKPRTKRVINRILANCGTEFEGTIFDGELVESEKRSDGFPTKIHIMNRNLSQKEIEKMLKATVQGRERLLSTAILEIPGWKSENNNDGLWTCSGLDITKDIYIYYHIFSPAQRKNIGSNLDVPNPEAFTFLDMTGDGKIEIIINGEKYLPIEFSKDGGTKTLPDIPLEIYYNHFLAKWIPSGENSKIKFRWRSIMRKPETSFGF